MSGFKSRARFVVVGFGFLGMASLAALANDTPNYRIKAEVACTQTAASKDVAAVSIFYEVRETVAGKPFNFTDIGLTLSMKECKALQKRMTAKGTFTVNQTSSAYAQKVEARVKELKADATKITGFPLPPTKAVKEDYCIGKITEIICDATDGTSIMHVIDDTKDPMDAEVCQVDFGPQPRGKKLCESLSPPKNNKALKIDQRVRVRTDDSVFAAFQLLNPLPKKSERSTAASTRTGEVQPKHDDDGDPKDAKGFK